jgi:hypothetical protein
MLVDIEEQPVIALSPRAGVGRRLGALELLEVGIKAGKPGLDAAKFCAHQRDVR